MLSSAAASLSTAAVAAEQPAQQQDSTPKAESPTEQPAKTSGQELEEVVITAYVRNFTDKLFLQSISGDIFPGNVAYGAPRRYGVTLQYNS